MMEQQALACAPVFSDHMVLQRDKRIKIFGTGCTGSRVTVTLDGCTAEAAVCDGHWSVTLPAHAAGGAYDMTVTDGRTALRFTDVLYGEVWLAGGQSNMEFELQNALNGREELAVCANSQLRFFNVPKLAFEDETYWNTQRQNCWRVSGPETCPDVSAVAYFCAKKLQKELDVPVGIIDCYWGGTSISCWMSETQLARSKAGQQYLDEYAAKIAGQTDADYDQALAAYNQELDVWNAHADVYRKEDPMVKWQVLKEACGAFPWPPPPGRKSQFRPAGLYHTMVQRVCPYTLRGFLYYQGEDDCARWQDYAEMMLYLIAQWRGDWHDQTLPFLFVQLPVFTEKEDYEAGIDMLEWPHQREQQQRVNCFVKGTGMVVALDCGEYDNLHPTDKRQVGARLALQALQKAYGRAVEADGPILTECVPQNGTLRLTFAHTMGGLELRGECGGAFEVAGDTGVFHPAVVRVQGNSLLLSSAQVPKPDRARYAWYSYGSVPLYGGSGLPAAPFRTAP